MRELEGRVAVVTGGASGIGRALAERFAREGTRLVLADVERAALEATASALREGGAEVLAVPTDVAKAGDVERLAARTLERFGGVHLLCNNAGVTTGNTVWEHSLEDWAWVLGVNLWGVIHGLRSFVPRMLEQGEPAHVVNTASMSGLVPLPHASIYQASKHAVVTISESLHLELAEREAPVRVSVLCPGFVRTPIIDADRNRPAELAPPSDEPSEVWETMQKDYRRWLEGGADPAYVADLVLRAVREERFWILPHPAGKEWIRKRTEGILEERNPTLDPSMLELVTQRPDLG